MKPKIIFKIAAVDWGKTYIRPVGAFVGEPDPKTGARRFVGPDECPKCSSLPKVGDMRLRYGS